MLEKIDQLLEAGRPGSAAVALSNMDIPYEEFKAANKKIKNFPVRKTKINFPIRNMRKGRRGSRWGNGHL